MEKRNAIKKIKEIKQKLCKSEFQLKISVGTHDTFSFQKHISLFAVHSKDQEMINPPAKIISVAEFVVSKYHSPRFLRARLADFQVCRKNLQYELRLCFYTRNQGNCGRLLFLWPRHFSYTLRSCHRPKLEYFQYQ